VSVGIFIPVYPINAAASLHFSPCALPKDYFCSLKNPQLAFVKKKYPTGTEGQKKAWRIFGICDILVFADMLVITSVSVNIGVADKSLSNLIKPAILSRCPCLICRLLTFVGGININLEDTFERFNKWIIGKDFTRL
jgi:hypothetical protein